MRKNAWYVILGAAVLVGAVGCGDDDDGGIIVPDDGGVADSGTSDSGAPDSGGPTACGASGTAGGLCRTGTCGAGLECVEGLGSTARQGLGIPQAEATDSTNTAFREVAAPVATNDVPIRIFAGEMCVDQCNTASSANTCGSCATCSDEVGYDALGLPTWWWLEGIFDNAEFGENTGVCRANCQFDPNTNGGCPEGYTCDAYSNICLEGCLSDAQCNATLVLTENGDLATWVVPDGGRFCNFTTGRCEWNNPRSETVGDVCERQADCSEDVGFCLLGGTCAETQCGTAADTTEEGICDGGRGVCIGVGGNNGTLCVQGCNSSADCNPGNHCDRLVNNAGMPVTVGDFTGICFPVCDETSTCRSGEACDLARSTPVCAPTCDPSTQTGCEAGEFCEAAAGSTTVGFCRPLNDFCFEAGTVECYNGQICDNAIGAGDYGRCVDACTPPVAGDPCDGVDAADRCTAPGTSCDEGDLVTCAPNAQGCLVETRTTCTEGCEEAGGAAECTASDTCPDPALCTEGRSCVDGNLVICAPDANGCLVETTTPCAAGCDASGSVAVCVTPDATPSSCAAGDVCIQDSGSPLNGLCATPCTAATSATVCGAGRTCQVPTGASSGFCVEG